MSSLFVPTLQLDALQAALVLPNKSSYSGLPVANSTHSFWINTPGANPLAKEGSEGDLTQDADICIIGSGITGVSTAYHLAKLLGNQIPDTQAPIKTTILEARDFCSGATGRNGGHLTPAVFLDFANRELSYGSEEAMKTYALENYTAAELIHIIKTEGLVDTVDLVLSNHLTLFVTEKEVSDAQRDYAAAERAGVYLGQVSWQNEAKMTTEYGTSYPAFKFPGHNLWPLKLVTELYKLAHKQAPNKFSLNLHTNTPVTAISPIPSSSSHRRWSLSTPRGNINCSYVIHATNAYASHLLPHMHGPAGIIPTRGQIIALRADTPLSNLTNASWSGNEGMEYWFPRPVNTSEQSGREENPLVILGGGREVTKPKFEYYITDDSVVREDVGKALRDFLPGMFPGKYKQGREPEMEWTGIMGYTKLQDPFVGPVVGPSKSDHVGQYIAAGYSGHGMPRAYACAEVVAGMVTAEITGGTWTAPDWLPRHFLTANRTEI